MSRIRQLRLVVHASDYEQALHFFRNALGAPVAEEYASDGAHVTILDVGGATLELSNDAQVELIDRVEVGRRVAPHFRVALEVDDCEASTCDAVGGGAEQIAAAHPHALGLSRLGGCRPTGAALRTAPRSYGAS